MILLKEKPENHGDGPRGLFPMATHFSMALIVSFVYFEICLRVIADRTNLRGAGADYDMSAVAAFPDFNFTLFKHFLHFNVFE